MKKDSIQKTYLGVALLASVLVSGVLVPTQSVEASNYLLDSGIVYNAETFDDGLTIVKLEGDYNKLVTDFQKIKFENILEGRLFGTHLNRNLDTNDAEAFIIYGPKGSYCANPEKTVKLYGDLDKVDSMAQRYIWWETIKYDGWGHMDNAKGEVIYKYQL